MNDLLTREATEAEIAQLTEINELTWPYEKASTDRAPWTVTLNDGFAVILYFPLEAAVAVQNAGHHILASSERDLAENFAKFREPKFDIEWIACVTCTRHDTCGNHAQHGEGCHCLYRGRFFYVYNADNSRHVVCQNHYTPAANVVEIEFM